MTLALCAGTKTSVLYGAEVVRGGHFAVPKGLEAATSIGTFPKSQALFKIIFPQAFVGMFAGPPALGQLFN